jgi:Ca2+-transporting ATPase
MTLALAQVFHLGNARSVEPVLSHARLVANRYAVGAVVLSVVLQLLAVSVEPVKRVLGVVSLSATEWAVVLAMAAIPPVVGQVLKLRAASTAIAPLGPGEVSSRTDPKEGEASDTSNENW